MSGHAGLSSATAAAVALAAACHTRPAAPPPEPAGVAGLVATLTTRRDAGCQPDPAQRDRLVTASYRGHAALPASVRSYEATLAAAAPATAPITARILYADDPAVPASLRRARPVLPVGRPPLVAFVGDAAVPALFVHDAGRWCCLIDPDALVADALADPACRAAYLAAERGRCLDLTAPIASAALDGDTAALTRLCTLLVHQGCGSVPAQSPP